MDLQLDDFEQNEIEEYFTPCALDPGRRDIFQAAYGAGDTPHEIRHCSTKEYYQLTGSPDRNKKLQNEKKRLGIEYIESSFPTAKTADIAQHKEYVRYLFWHLDTLFSFYNFNRSAESRFRDYQGKQRAREELMNMITNGGKKYNKRKRKKRSTNRRSRKIQRKRRKLFKRK